MDSEPLLPQTYRLLDATNLTYGQIAHGCSVGKNWLMKLKQRKIKEPGIAKIQRVRDFLAAYEAIHVPPVTSVSESAA